MAKNIKFKHIFFSDSFMIEIHWKRRENAMYKVLLEKKEKRSKKKVIMFQLKVSHQMKSALCALE